MKKRIPLGFFAIPVALIVLISLFVFLTVISSHIGSEDSYAALSSITHMRVIVVVSLMCTLILLCTGLVVLFRSWDRPEMNETFPLPAEGRSPVPPEDDETVYGGENEVTTTTLDDALRSINSSLERLQAINDRIHEQNESLIKISHALSGYRDFRTETAQFRYFPSARETPPSASSAAPAKTETRAPIPFVSPAAPGKSMPLSEAEILAIHLNNIKLRHETTFFRNDDYSKSQR